jgi:ATP-dependent helicase/DNAse subunit B
MRFVKNSSFIRALELVKYPKIYFLKEQKPQFIKILRKLITTLQQENMTIDDAYNCIQEDQKYDTIRVEEPDLCAYRSLPLL